MTNQTATQEHYYIRSNAYWPQGYTPGPQDVAPAVAGPYLSYDEASIESYRLYRETDDKTLHITTKAAR